MRDVRQENIVLLLLHYVPLLLLLLLVFSGRLRLMDYILNKPLDDAKKGQERK